jgi:NarL family two-component system response regulator LiaR
MRPEPGGVALRARVPALAQTGARDHARVAAAPAPSPQPAIDVVVVDADPAAQRAVAGALAAAGIRVRAVAGSGRDGARLVAELEPAVVIVDPRLPDMDGMAFLHALRQDAPDALVLLLTADTSEDFALRALRAGAAGVLGRQATREALPRAVRSLAAGEAVMTRAMSMRLVELLRVQPVAGHGLRPVRSALSTREWEVLDLICAGAGTRAIADELGLSAETVRSHVKRLLRKLGAHSRAEAAAIATRTLADCSGSAGPWPGAAPWV